MRQKKTDDLESILQDTKPENLDQFLSTYADSMVKHEKPFAVYIRKALQAHGFKQQEVFLRADISEKYGYRLLSEEKRTRQRDYILRICFAAELTAEETQKALQLYGMPPLYPRIPRDAALLIALQNGLYELEQVNTLLLEHGMEPLKASTMRE